MRTLSERYPDGKHCKGCGTVKPVSDFYLTKVGTLKPRCKPCHSMENIARRMADVESSRAYGRQKSRERRKRDPDAIRASQKASRSRDREKYRLKNRLHQAKPESKAKKAAYAKSPAELAARAEYRKRNAKKIRDRNAGYYRANREVVIARIKASWDAKPGLYRKLRHAAHTARRARVRGATTEGNFLHVEIFERDHWVCHLCGRSVDPTKVWPDPLSPSLDHVRPIAKGGEHSRANAACSHLRCNLVKNKRYERLPRPA